MIPQAFGVMERSANPDAPFVYWTLSVTGQKSIWDADERRKTQIFLFESA
jgi:hypothetical protein